MPRFSVAWISGNIRYEKGFRTLIPEDELGLTGVLEVGDDLVVLLRFSASFDDVTLPRNIGIEVRSGIFPPPDLVALPVASPNQIQVTIAVDVIGYAACFKRKVLFFDGVDLPFRPDPAIPDQTRSLLTEAENEILNTVSIEIGGERAGLLV